MTKMLYNQLIRKLLKTNVYKFSGNRSTLKDEPLEKGIQVRDELLKFHAKYYSSNIMTLCVLGRQSVEELKSIVIDMFSGIVNKEVEIPRYSDGPYLDEHLKIRIDIFPVQDERTLALRFPVPYHVKTHYKTKVYLKLVY